MTNPLIAVTAFIDLLVGLVAVWLARGNRSGHFERDNNVAWILIALFPVLLIFGFFPGNTVSGSALGFSVTGAFGGFILLYLLGTKQSRKAETFDELRRQLESRDGEIAALKQQNIDQAKRPQPIDETRVILYRIHSSPTKQVGVVTGNLGNVKCASIWVNSENTNMQMSRYFEDTVSAMIRFLGAKRDNVGNVIDDCIGNHLKAQMGLTSSVPDGHVLTTTPGELANTHNVKSVYHVASVHGQLGVGYRQIPNIAVCVTNVLERAESEGWAENEPHSIIFPLLGANVGQGPLEATIKRLVTAALDHFARTPASSIDVVYFLAFTDIERDACITFLDNEAKVKAVAPE